MYVSMPDERVMTSREWKDHGGNRGIRYTRYLPSALSISCVGSQTPSYRVIDDDMLIFND